MAAEGEKDPLLDSITPAIPKKTSKPARKPTRQLPTRSLHLSITLGILCLFVLYAQRNGSGRAVYKNGGMKMPDSYAICTKEGLSVYSVPEDSGVGGVECVVVQGKTVLDIGSRGQLLFPRKSELIHLSSCTSDMVGTAKFCREAIAILDQAEADENLLPAFGAFPNSCQYLLAVS